MKNLCLGVFAAIIFAAVGSIAAHAQKLKPEEFLAKHVESLGTAEARAAAKNRMAVGSVLVTFISQKNQTAEGRAVLVSADSRNFVGMNLNASDYTSEKFTFDGKKPAVGFAFNGIRSALGNFVQSNDWIVEESLFGGTLAGTWSLGSATPKGKVSYNGIKKSDGKEYHVVGYSKKGGGDIDVKLFFDKDTFRHVRTEYVRMSSAGIGTNPNQSSGFNETRYKLTEEFGDFKDEKGLMLPHSYRIHYLTSGQRGTTEIEWKISLAEFVFNQNLDDSTFAGSN